MKWQPSKEVETQLSEKLLILNLTASNEPAFIKLECLFYDVLALARTAAEESSNNAFLNNLEKIKENEFRLTQLSYQKAKQREIFIKKFKTAFKKELASYLKNVKSLAV
jgi:hypothetical protein